MIAVPMTKVIPVPTAYKGGTPKTKRLPVIKNPPPIPKKPLKVPTINPNTTSIIGFITISALGKNITLNHFLRSYTYQFQNKPKPYRYNHNSTHNE